MRVSTSSIANSIAPIAAATPNVDDAPAEERAALVEQLRRDTGIGGRARRLSDESERCRMRVSKAIQRAIGRIEAADPVLGRALATRIRTGYVLSVRDRSRAADRLDRARPPLATCEARPDGTPAVSRLPVDE